MVFPRSVARMVAVEPASQAQPNREPNRTYGSALATRGDPRPQSGAAVQRVARRTQRRGMAAAETITVV